MSNRSFRKVSVGKGIKKPRSTNMIGLKPSYSELKRKILDKRAKQSVIIGKIKDDLKKIRENNISIGGLDDISPKSITRLQEKRKKSLIHLNSNVGNLNVLLKDITKLEMKYSNIKNS